MKLANALVSLALCDERHAPGWAEVRALLGANGHDDPDADIIEGIRDGHASPVLSDDDEPEWLLRVRLPAARVVLLDYARSRLERAGIPIEEFFTYEGDDRRVVVSMGIELEAMGRGLDPAPRLDVYRDLLRG